MTEQSHEGNERRSYADITEGNIPHIGNSTCKGQRSNEPIGKLVRREMRTKMEQIL